MAKPVQDKVGHNLPTEEEFREMSEQLRSLINKIRTFGVALTKAQRKALNNPRRGSEEMVHLVLDLAEQEGVKVKNVTRQGILDDLRLAKAALNLFNLFTVGQQLAKDTLRQAKSEYWEGTLAIYRVLQALAESNPDLAQQIDPMVQFMALGPQQEEEEEDAKEETEL